VGWGSSAAVFFIFAFLALLQQEVTFGIWFQSKDFHHESFALASVALGLDVLIGSLIIETNERTVS